MALGKPAIATPARLEIRAIGDAISNIRQRIEAIEAQTGTNFLSVTQLQNAGNVQISTLRQLLDQLEARVTVLETEIVAFEDVQPQLAVRVFMPHNPIPAPRDEGAGLLAARAFLPHVPLTQPILPQDGATILANQIFGA
jgi:hypothetical protein